MRDDILPLFLDALRLNPAVDMGASLAEIVRGKGGASSALAFLPFLRWGKKAKTGAKLLKRVAKIDEPAELGASALKAGERQWAQGLGGPLRAAPPMPFARRAAHEIGATSAPLFQQYNQPTASAARMADEMFRNMERFSK